MTDKLINTGATIANVYGNLGTTWATIASVMPTSVESAFGSWSNLVSTFTAPASNLPDGILFLWNIEFEDSSNGRCAPRTRFSQTSGTGDFISTESGGYNRDNSEDRSFCSGFAFVDNPSASSTYILQGIRDTDAPGATDGSVNSSVMIVPFWYSNIGMYTSSDTSLFGGTSPNQVASWTTVLESDTAAIQRTTNNMQIKGDNKRYVIFGGYSQEGSTNGSRSQRIMKLRAATTPIAMAYSMHRNAANNNNGSFCSDLYETVTTDVNIDMVVYRGDGVLAREGGADSDGGTGTPTAAAHQMLILELNDDAEVFKSHSTAQQECALAGPVDISIADTLDFNDAASFTKASATVINVEQAMDAAVFGNIAAPRNTSSIGSSSRWTARSHLTVNGTEDNTTRHGNYSRGNQSSTDCHGWVAQPCGVLTLAANDDLGVSVQEISGTEGGGGDIETEPFGSNEGVTFWGLNLDTLEAAAGPVINTKTLTDSAVLTDPSDVALRLRDREDFSSMTADDFAEMLRLRDRDVLETMALDYAHDTIRKREVEILNNVTGFVDTAIATYVAGGSDAVFNVTKTDSLSTSDLLIALSRLRYRIINEAFDLIDTSLPERSRARLMADTIAMTDDAIHNKIVGRILGDSISNADFSIALRDRSRELLSAVESSDNQIPERLRYRLLSDNISLVDFIVVLGSDSDIVIDLITITDAIALQRTRQRISGETITLTEGIEFLRRRERLLAESVGDVLDAVIASRISGAKFVTLLDSVAANDFVEMQRFRDRLLQDAFDVVDNTIVSVLTAGGINARTLSDDLIANDFAEMQRFRARLHNEAMDVVDNAISIAIHNRIKGTPVTARSNLIADSHDLESSEWGTSDLAVTAGIDDPDGGNNAFRLTNNGTTSGRTQLMRNVPYEEVWGGSWIRRVSGTGSIYMYVGFQSNATIIDSQLTGNDWSFVDTGGATFHPTKNGRAGYLTFTAGDVFDVYHPQYNYGDQLASYVESIGEPTHEGVIDIITTLRLRDRLIPESITSQDSSIELRQRNRIANENFGGVENLMPASEDLVAHTEVGITVISDTGDPPHGVGFADKMVEVNAASIPRTSTGGITTIIGNDYIYSFFAKAPPGERSECRAVAEGSSAQSSYFDMELETATPGSFSTSGIQAKDGDWFRCWFRYTALGTSPGPYIATAEAGVWILNGDDTKGLFIAGQMFEEVPSTQAEPSEYVGPTPVGGTAIEYVRDDIYPTAHRPRNIQDAIDTSTNVIELRNRFRTLTDPVDMIDAIIKTITGPDVGTLILDLLSTSDFREMVRHRARELNDSIPGRTNLVPQSIDPSNASFWTQQVISTTEDGVAPNGHALWKFDDQSTGFGFIRDTMSADGSLKHVHSFHFLKDNVPKETRWCLMRAAWTGGSAVNIDMKFATDDPLTYGQMGGGSGVVHDFGFVDEGKYWRAWFIHDDGGSGNNTVSFQFYPAVGDTTWPNFTSSAMGFVHGYGPDVKQGDALTAYVPTDGLSVTEYLRDSVTYSRTRQRFPLDIATLTDSAVRFLLKGFILSDTISLVDAALVNIIGPIKVSFIKHAVTILNIDQDVERFPIKIGIRKET